MALQKANNLVQARRASFCTWASCLVDILYLSSLDDVKFQCCLRSCRRWHVDVYVINKNVISSYIVCLLVIYFNYMRLFKQSCTFLSIFSRHFLSFMFSCVHTSSSIYPNVSAEILHSLTSINIWPTPSLCMIGCCCRLRCESIVMTKASAVTRQPAIEVAIPRQT